MHNGSRAQPLAAPLAAAPLAAAFLGVALLGGCRAVLGLSEVGCFDDSHCGPNMTCSPAHACVMSASAPNGHTEPDDAGVAEGSGPGSADPALTAADGGKAIDAQPSPPGSVIASATRPDAQADDGPTSNAFGTDASDPHGGAGPPDAGNAVARDDVSQDAPDAEIGDSTVDACIASNGLCSACSVATCNRAYLGWSQPPYNPGYVSMSAGRVDAVPIDVAQPSWLMRLGVQSITGGAKAHLALYDNDAQVDAGAPAHLLADVDITVQPDDTTHGSEGSVTGSALCVPLAPGRYWVAATFDRDVFVESNNRASTVRYEWEGGLDDAGSLSPANLGAPALQRNLYIVVAQP